MDNNIEKILLDIQKLKNEVDNNYNVSSIAFYKKQSNELRILLDKNKSSIDMYPSYLKSNSEENINLGYTLLNNIDNKLNVTSVIVINKKAPFSIRSFIIFIIILLICIMYYIFINY